MPYSHLFRVAIPSIGEALDKKVIDGKLFFELPLRQDGMQNLRPMAMNLVRNGYDTKNQSDTRDAPRPPRLEDVPFAFRPPPTLRAADLRQSDQQIPAF